MMTAESITAKDKKNSSAKKRVEYLDICKALAIIFVVFGHLLPENYGFHLLTGPIKMPLFYIISGYFFSAKNAGSVIRGLAKMVAPFLICCLIYAVFNRDSGNFLYELLYGESYLWFIPSFIITQLLFRLLYKITSNKMFLLAISLLFLCLGVYLHQYRLCNILCFDTALTGVFFYNIGLLYKNKEEKYHISDNVKIFSACSVIYVALIIVSCLIFSGETIDFHICSYYSLPLCVCLVISGTLALFYATKRYKKNNRVLLLIGKNTLIIYLTHPILYKIFDLITFSAFANNKLVGVAAKGLFAIFVGLLLSTAYNKTSQLKKLFDKKVGVEK